MQKNKTLFLDMDNVIVDFMTGVNKLEKSVLEAHRQVHGDKHLDDIEGVFGLMDPMPGAIEAVHELTQVFNTYVLSTSPWNNPSAWSDKVRWIHKHFGDEEDSPLYKRVILSHNKHLAIGDFLVDDRPNHGASEFGKLTGGEWIHFGTPGYEDWSRVTEYLLERADG